MLDIDYAICYADITMKTYTHKPLAVARLKLKLSLDDVLRELYADHQVKVSTSTIRKNATEPNQM